MTPADKIRALIAECQRDRDHYVRTADGILAAACAIRAAALKQCLKIVEEK